jgi:TetR/AcrR family transcriptional regulator, mexCD-oprJ operon repressor
MSHPLPSRRPAPGRHALQARVAGAILDAAALVFATRGEDASMNDVAEAAGIARATLYRYFPNRAALVEQLAQLAVDAAAEALATSRVNEVPPLEGVARAIRALIEVGDLFTVLARERVRPDPDAFEQSVRSPLRKLIGRARDAQEVRDDISPDLLTESLLALVLTVIGRQPALGREDAVAAAVTLFLDGARAHPRLVR